MKKWFKANWGIVVLWIIMLFLIAIFYHFLNVFEWKSFLLITVPTTSTCFVIAYLHKEINK